MQRFAWLLLWLPFSIYAASPVSLIGVDLHPGLNNSKFTFILSKRTPGKISYFETEQQLLIEFDNTNNHFKLHHAWMGNANVKTIDAIKVAPDKLRFVLSVRGQVQYKYGYSSDTTNGVRLLLEISSVPQDRKELKAAFSRDFLQLNNPVPESPEKKNHKFTVVIDAGHGGRDSGAIGVHGTYEKNVALSIARMLASEINREPDMRVVLTRTGDYFVPLRKRMKIAHKNKADIFIAIHADAQYYPQAEGISVFALSQYGATSEAARWLAQRQNYSELNNVELNRLQDNSVALRSVLIDLAQTVTIEDSVRLGYAVLTRLNNISALHSKRVEQAPFVVLKSPDVPSILVETGFITNPREEKRLNDPVYQHQVAYALQQGIEHYFKNVAEEQE